MKVELCLESLCGQSEGGRGYLGVAGLAAGISLARSFSKFAGRASGRGPFISALRKWVGRVDGAGSTLAIQVVRRTDCGLTEPSAFSWN